MTEVGRGDPQAAEDLLPLVYDELRRLARAKLVGERPGHTLQATALVHEAFLRLVGEKDPGWDNRGHFLAAAAEAMRRILVDQARSKARLKRGGELKRMDMKSCEPAIDPTIEPPGDDLLAIDEALKRLEAEDVRKGQVVNLRFFAGFTAQETADVLGVSITTVEREWRYVRQWLFAQLKAPSVRSDLDQSD